MASPKLEHSIMEEGKANGFKETAIKEDDTTLLPSNFQKIVAEIIGTYILIFIGCGSALVNKVQPLTIVGIAIVWGLVLTASIYALGHVSGAHFNPAVTIALAAARKFPWKHVPMYVVSQVLGSTLASLTLRVLLNEQNSIRVTMTQYSAPTSDLEAITWEFIITFILMLTICAVATDHRASKDLSGVAVGAALLVNVMVAGPITGASMNPARSLGPAIASGIYKNIWVYMIAPVLGALTATMVYSILRVPQKEEGGTKSIYNNKFFEA
ncbi:hypothetical protein UlMin_035203 [Ulmus minor]